MQMKTKNGCYKTKETTTLKINKSETKKLQIIQEKTDTLIVHNNLTRQL